jgi:hypothetical protein
MQPSAELYGAHTMQGSQTMPTREVFGVPITYGVEHPEMYASHSLMMNSRTMYGTGVGTQGSPWHY